MSRKEYEEHRAVNPIPLALFSMMGGRGLLELMLFGAIPSYVRDNVHNAALL